MTDSGSPEATDRKGPPPREITRAVRLLWVGLFAAPILSLCLIALYAVQARDWLTSLAILGSGTMVASGFALLGTLFGFLFGVPHVVQHGAGGQQPSSPASLERNNERPRYLASTNLEQISDWLTKILVGAGLAELRSLPKGFSDMGDTFAPAFGTFPSSKTFALGLIMFSSVVGFLLGYLFIRLYLTGVLEAFEE